MRLLFSRIDFEILEILNTIRDRPIENRDLVKTLMGAGGVTEGYSLSRIRGCEAKGYITRTKDGRSNLVEITDAGKRALELMSKGIE